MYENCSVSNTKPSLGILGAGKLSVVLSQLARKAGYRVLVSNSKDPQELALSFSILSPGTEVVTRETLAASSDIIILALPLSKYKTIPVHLFDRKIIIDAMNYWWEVDGSLDTIHPLATSSSEQVQAYFAGSKVIKALNHVGYHDLYDHAAKVGDPQRKAVAIAGDDRAAIDRVSRIINNLGFDPLIIGTLAAGRALEPGTNAFGASVDSNELRSLVSSYVS